MIEVSLEQDISKFEQCCNNMLNSKFVMVDKRISDLLNTIAESKFVYNLIAECVVPFNFDREFKLATKLPEVFIMPKDSINVVPFVFLLLRQLHEKKINILKFLGNHFKSEGVDSYKLFLESVIERFRDCVILILRGESKGNVNEDAIQKTNSFTKELASRIEYLLKDFYKKLENEKKVGKEILNNSKILTEALYKNLKALDSQTVEALFIGLKNVIKENKKLTKQISEIEQLIQLIK